MIGVKNTIIGIKETGHTVTVPDSPMACIMYYLNCINSLIDLEIPQNLRNYQNYNKISFDEENRILSLANLLNPTLFIMNGIMINNVDLCANKSNKFYDITNSRIAFAFSREFAISNRKVHTLKIMAFKTSWLEKNYINPIKTYSRRISAIANGTVERMRPRRLAYNRPSEHQYSIKDTNYQGDCNIF